MTIRPHTNRTLATLAALIIGAGLGTGTLAGSASAEQDTSAIAVNTRDDSSVFRLKFQIFNVNRDTVDNGNAAVAYASCELCQTVAISIQVLLVASDPSDFEPTNLAIAYNENCALCATLASAYQFAFGIGERLKFTAEGRQQLAVIRQELEGLRQSDMSIFDMQEALGGYMQQLSAVLNSELIGAAEPAVGEQGASQPEPQATATTPTTTPTESATPAEPTTSTEPAPGTQTEPSTTETTPATTETTPTETTPTTTETTPTTTDTTPTTTEPAP